MTKSARKIIQMLVCVAACFLLIIQIRYLGARQGKTFVLGSYVLNTTGIMGTLSSLTALICYLMIFIEYRYGTVIGISIISLEVLSNLYTILKSHTLNSLPGLITSLFAVTAILIISRIYRKSYKSSHTDLLTGLGNRRSFIDKMEDKFLIGKPFTLACIEIMNFKNINGMVGIQAGDLILKKASEFLKGCITDEDRLYRMTGVTFMIVFDENSDVETSLKKIMELEKKQVDFVYSKDPENSVQEEQTVCYKLAIGISKFPDDAKDFTTIIRHADIALAHAQNQTENKVITYNEELEKEQQKQAEADRLITESLEKDWFYLMYQPQFTLEEKKLRGFETLIRCKKPDGSIVSPAFFIPAAEKSNLILKIDDYVLKRAINESKKMLEKTQELCTISVNVSAKNISSEGFAEKVIDLIEKANFQPECLEIEITEYSFVKSLEVTVENINKLRAHGVQIALDDFGTGYTSIAQVMNLPVNLLKIDKSLIDEIESSQKKRNLVNSIISMGHIMNCEVISEGVENEQQLDILRTYDCDFIQGYVWSKPIEYNAALELSQGKAE